MSKCTQSLGILLASLAVMLVAGANPAGAQGPLQEDTPLQDTWQDLIPSAAMWRSILFLSQLDGRTYYEFVDTLGDAHLYEVQDSTQQARPAIRNARVFEYVVSTYCKQRQGQRSCHGCERPHGSWTPSVKYREVGV